MSRSNQMNIPFTIQDAGSGSTPFSSLVSFFPVYRSQAKPSQTKQASNQYFPFRTNHTVQTTSNPIRSNVIRKLIQLNLLLKIQIYYINITNDSLLFNNLKITFVKLNCQNFFLFSVFHISHIRT